MRIIGKILLSALLVFYYTPTFAVTLEEALTNSYDYNEDLKSIRTSFLDEIEAFPRALSGFMPRMHANFNSIDSKTKHELPNDMVQTSKGNRYEKSITLEQRLFDGWSSIAELRAAKEGFGAARADYYSKEQETLLKNIEIYLSCVADKEKYAVSKISVKSNKAQLEAMKEKFKLGEATATEVASAKEGLATAEANQAVSYANYESIKAAFYQAFGINAENIAMPEIPLIPDNLESIQDRALSNNPRIDSASHRTKSFKASEAVAKGQLLPKVSFNVTHSRTQYRGSSKQINNNSNNPNNKNTSSAISVNIPIFSKGGIEYSDIRRAKHKTRLSIIDFDNAVKRIKSSSLSKWSEYEASKIQIIARMQAVKAAEIAYEGMMQEEMLGSKTIIDVLHAEDKLNKAREAQIDAKKSLVFAAYGVKSLIGDLTAKSMGLKVNYFSPEEEFRKIKTKIIGF